MRDKWTEASLVLSILATPTPCLGASRFIVLAKCWGAVTRLVKQSRLPKPERSS